jgi:hypothetical protein
LPSPKKPADLREADYTYFSDNIAPFLQLVTN